MLPNHIFDGLLVLHKEVPFTGPEFSFGFEDNAGDYIVPEEAFNLIFAALGPYAGEVYFNGTSVIIRFHVAQQPVDLFLNLRLT